MGFAESRKISSVQSRDSLTIPTEKEVDGYISETKRFGRRVLDINEDVGKDKRRGNKTGDNCRGCLYASAFSAG